MKKVIRDSITFALMAAATYALATFIFDFRPTKQAIREDVGSKVVTITRTEGRGGGTGFFVTAPSGSTYILTNYHVCQLKDKDNMLNVKTQDGDRFIPKKVVEMYKDHDLCLIEPIIGYEGLDVSSDKPLDGSDIYVVGHPKLYPLVVSEGQYIGEKTIKIAYRNTSAYVMGNDFLSQILELLKQQMAGYPSIIVKTYTTSHIIAYTRGGSSGSPIVNNDGEVVAVLFAGVPMDNHDSYGVPLRYIERFLEVY